MLSSVDLCKLELNYIYENKHVANEPFFLEEKMRKDGQWYQMTN